MEGKKTDINDIYKAAWLGLKGIDVTAVRKAKKIQFETLATDKTRTTLTLYGLRPRVDLHDYVAQLKKLSASAQSLRRDVQARKS